jgi:hypothetical protein
MEQERSSRGPTYQRQGWDKFEDGAAVVDVDVRGWICHNKGLSVSSRIPFSIPFRGILSPIFILPIISECYINVIHFCLTGIPNETISIAKLSGPEGYFSSRASVKLANSLGKFSVISLNSETMIET